MSGVGAPRPSTQGGRQQLGLLCAAVALLLLIPFATVPALAAWVGDVERQATLAIARLAAAVPGIVRASSLISDNALFKGIVVMTAFWGVWFSVGASANRRLQLVSVLLLSVIAMAVGRSLALLLPFRVRPRYMPEHAQLFGDPGYSLEGWSSMPSDHAVLFFALAVGIGFVQRSVGLFLVAHAILLVCLPRIILGLHHAGDIVVGALIGSAVAVLTAPILVRNLKAVDVEGLIARRPGWFYAVAIWITTQFAFMFEPLRHFVSDLLA